MSRVDDATRRALFHLHAEQLDAALDAARTALRFADEDPASPEEIARAYEALARVQDQLGDVAGAAASARRLVGLRARADDDDEALAHARVFLANHLVQLGELREAEEHLAEALASYETARGPDDYETTVVRGKLAMVHVRLQTSLQPQ